MHDCDGKILQNLIIENKCDELLIERLDAFSKESQMKKVDYDDDVFSDQELIVRAMALIDEEVCQRNIGFLRYVARRFQVDEELFFDFTGRELK